LSNIIYQDIKCNVNVNAALFILGLNSLINTSSFGLFKKKKIIVHNMYNCLYMILGTSLFILLLRETGESRN